MSIVGLLRDVRLTTGIVPVVLGLLTVWSLAFTMGRRPRWVRVGIVFLVAVATVVIARLSLPGSVDVARIPRSFYVWAAVPVVAIGVVAVSWPSASTRRRLLGLVAIPIALVFAANQVNVWFSYVPTAADLVGGPIPDEVALDRLVPRPTHGSIVRLDIPATASGFHHRRSLVWLPPAYGPQPRPTLPVVMMLAGTPGRPDDLLRSGDLGAVADRYAAAHGGTAPILVFPDHNGRFTGDTECVDAPGARAETYLTTDVPAAVTAEFGARPQGWGLFGYSEGGTCALTLTLRHPQLFSTFVDIGGDQTPNLGTGHARDLITLRDLFGNDAADRAAQDPLTLLAQHHYDGVAGRFVVASADPPARRSASVLLPAAQAAGIDAVRIDSAGHHSFAFVSSVAPATFGWLADRVAATPTGSARVGPR